MILKKCISYIYSYQHTGHVVIWLMWVMSIISYNIITHKSVAFPLIKLRWLLNNKHIWNTLICRKRFCQKINICLCVCLCVSLCVCRPNCMKFLVRIKHQGRKGAICIPSLYFFFTFLFVNCVQLYIVLSHVQIYIYLDNLVKTEPYVLNLLYLLRIFTFQTNWCVHWSLKYHRGCKNLK